MSLVPESEVREVSEITAAQKLRIYDFLQGAVYCWCKNRPNEWFSIKDLLGGDNFDWNGTPLIVLYEKHENKGKPYDEAVADAGKDAGWIAKKVIDDDSRTFETRKGYVRSYKWKK